MTNVTVLGRSEEADVVLGDPYASEFHMRLVAADNGITLHDLGEHERDLRQRAPGHRPRAAAAW